ncbi:hypothetical protein B0T25DRAFT_496281 [Lasiosphaeria hispida]|uniref:NAD-dependent epimerase/dehydratase domain-containing protein n=1 Tax=Lasiosphaeria hispida TaxID=260671 RepID=A0AAJ0MIL5_9PEZI|nr:hypothetical protein B0T25DRAFT_496281 [Lasiosphaeria hispida]
MSSPPTHILLTGATGFIGAHILDALLTHTNLPIRIAVRSPAKGAALLSARPQHTARLSTITIPDFSSPTLDLTPALAGGIDGVIHVASPVTYAITDNEAELIQPAIRGVEAVLAAAAAAGGVKRVVLTSSFAAVLDISRSGGEYTAADWNPITYAEGVAGSPVEAYRASKKFAERAAWEFVGRGGAGFDLVAIAPPMVFGPVVHPVGSVRELNDSAAVLWRAAEGREALPVARVAFWVDVRDLAEAHVQALLRPEAGGKRYLVAAPERFNYALAATIVGEEFEFAKGRVVEGSLVPDQSKSIDGRTAARELGISYRGFRESVVDLVAQISKKQEEGW